MPTQYSPPKHIVIRRRTDAITDGDLAFVEKALAIQLREAAAHYGLAPPGVTFCGESAVVASTEAAGMDFVDEDGTALGVAHHGYVAGFPWSLIGVRETDYWTMAASHEALEYLCNLRLDQWVRGPGNTLWPKEIADPVESDAYNIEVEIFGEKRQVQVSNYVLPAYWDASNKTGPWDRQGVLRGPFTIAPGGYAVVEEDWKIREVGASIRHPLLKHGPSRPWSRAEQIIRGWKMGLRHAGTP
jgi:hypothetical protein